MLVEKIKSKGMLISRTYEYIPEPIKGSKAIKQEKKDTLKINVGTIPLDADTISIIYFNSVINLANKKFAQELANGVAPATAYNTVYSQTISWKGADNQIHTMTIEDLSTALSDAMLNIASIVGV